MRDVIPVFCVDGKIAFVPFVGVDDDFLRMEIQASKFQFILTLINIIIHMEAGAL